MAKDEEKPNEEQQTAAVLEKLFGKPSAPLSPSSEEAENVRLIIAEWLKPEHIRRKTRLTKRQVIAISILQALADTYEIKTLQRFLDEFRTSKLSEEGKTSAELENILKARMPEIQKSNLEKIQKFLE